MILMSCLIYDIQFRICIPASDAIEGRIGEGVEEMLGMSTGELIRCYSIF